MKRKILFLCIVFVFICLIVQCKKEDSPSKTNDITLYNKPISVIKQYINGKWILHYDIGGLDGKTKHNYVNSYVEFKFGSSDSIIRNINGTIEIRSLIKWFTAPDIFTGSTINLLGFNLYGTGIPFAYRISGITNDTLMIADPVADGYGYTLTKK